MWAVNQNGTLVTGTKMATLVPSIIGTCMCDLYSYKYDDKAYGCWEYCSTHIPTCAGWCS
jgi:hypothetical protein